MVGTVRSTALNPKSPVSLEALSIRLNRLENRTIEPVINRLPARGTVPADILRMPGVLDPNVWIGRQKVDWFQDRQGSTPSCASTNVHGRGLVSFPAHVNQVDPLKTCRRSLKEPLSVS